MVFSTLLCHSAVVGEINKDQNNLAKGKITRLIMLYLLSYQVAARVAKLILGCIWDPFWRRGGCRGSAVVQFERARLSIVTIATLSKHSATVCCHISDTIIERGRSLCGKIWGGRGRSM